MGNRLERNEPNKKSIGAIEMKAGDYVVTPRFLTVKIEEVFPDTASMRHEGFTEPTHYENPEYTICGKSTGFNRMIFAAAKK
jgi:hypothetical protein